MFAVAQIDLDVVRHSLAPDDYGAFVNRVVGQLDGPFDFVVVVVAAVEKLKAVDVVRAQIRPDALDFEVEPAVGDAVIANGPNSNEIAVGLSVYSMRSVGHLNEERVQDAVNGFADVLAVAVADEPPDLNGFEIVAELDVICDSAVIDPPNGLDSVDSDDSNVVGADFGHLANADWARPNWINVDNLAAPIGCVRTIHAEVVDSIDVALLPMLHTMHTAIDLPVELGGLPDTSDAQLLGCNAGEHAVAGPAVDSTLRSLAVGASVLADREIAFFVDLVADTRKCVAGSQPVIVIDVASVVQLVDGRTPCHWLDMDQLVHWPVFPIHPNHRDHLVRRVDHPWNTYCPRVIGMMDIGAVAVAADVEHGVARMRPAAPLVVVRLHRIGSMHHCEMVSFK